MGLPAPTMQRVPKPGPWPAPPHGECEGCGAGFTDRAPRCSWCLRIRGDVRQPIVPVIPDQPQPDRRAGPTLFGKPLVAGAILSPNEMRLLAGVVREEGPLTDTQVAAIRDHFQRRYASFRAPQPRLELHQPPDEWR